MTRPSRANHLDPGRGGEQPGQAVAEEGVVVDDEDTGHPGTDPVTGTLRACAGVVKGRQPRLDRDARRAVRDRHGAAEFLGPLVHDGQAVAWFPAARRRYLYGGDRGSADSR